jgi:hypothetical protein
VLEEARRINGILVIISVYELRDDGLRIQVYAPTSGTSTTHILNKYERRHLLGTLQRSKGVWAEPLVSITKTLAS